MTLSTQDTAKEIEFFGREVSAHREYDVLGATAYRSLLRLFEEMVGPRPGERCVDMGCGTGAFTRRLSRYGLDLLGIDITPTCIEYASQRAKGERYLIGDVRATGLHPETCDIVVYSGVLHHFGDRDERLAALREGHRLLRPGGRVFAFDPSAESPSMWLYRDPRSPLHSTKGKTPNEVLLDRSDLRLSLTQAGFTDVRIRATSKMTFRHVAGPLGHLLLPLYNAYELALGSTSLERRFGTFLVTAAMRP